VVIAKIKNMYIYHRQTASCLYTVIFTLVNFVERELWIKMVGEFRCKNLPYVTELNDDDDEVFLHNRMLGAIRKICRLNLQQLDVSRVKILHFPN